MINRMLAVPMLILVVLMLVFSYGQNKKMQETFMDNRRKIGDINSSLQDTLAGIRVVQSFANERIEQEKFNRSNENFLISKDANYRCMGSFMSGNAFFQGMMYLVTLVFGGFLIAHGRMEASDLAMYALYIGIFISPIQILVELTEMMQKGLSGFRRFLEVVETEPDIVDAADAKPLKNVKGNVCYEDVSFHYSDDDTPVLSHVSFEIPAGKSIALVGPSGSGKTTIARLAARFYDADEGEVLLGGSNIKEYDKTSLMRKISFVFQNARLFKMSLRENLLCGKEDAIDKEIEQALFDAGAKEIVDGLKDGLETVYGTKGTYFSGGEAQRLVIARAFLKDAEYVILDEATAFADPENERIIQESFKKLAENKTTLLIAHRLSTVVNADKILVIEKGRIAEEGKHEALLEKNGIYKSLWDEYRRSVNWKIGDQL